MWLLRCVDMFANAHAPGMSGAEQRGEGECGSRKIAASAANAVDCGCTLHGRHCAQLYRSVDTRDWQSEDPRGIWHQRHWDWSAAIRLVDLVRLRPASSGPPGGQDRVAAAAGLGSGAVVRGPGGGRTAGRFHAVSMEPCGAGPVRVTSFSRSGPHRRELVPPAGSWQADGGIHDRRRSRPHHRHTGIDRVDAGLRLAGHVCRHGCCRPRWCGRLVRHVSRPQPGAHGGS